jgi:signal transduction histidine kinase
VTRLNRSIDSMRRQLEGRPFVETFAADLSHELKNPVAAVRASAEVLQEGAIDDPEAARLFVTRIHQAAVRIERLLGELMSLARIEARGAESFERVDLLKIVEAARDEAEGGRIRIDAQGDTRVRGDRNWLARGVGNLIDNALVHSAPGSEVELTLRREASEVVLSVANEGSVPRHARTRLFRRFVTTRADQGGSGLGLAIVRAIAEAHAGRAELVDAGPPRVVFRLILPAARRLGADGTLDPAEASGRALERSTTPGTEPTSSGLAAKSDVISDT